MIQACAATGLQHSSAPRIGRLELSTCRLNVAGSSQYRLSRNPCESLDSVDDSIQGRGRAGASPAKQTAKCMTELRIRQKGLQPVALRTNRSMPAKFEIYRDKKSEFRFRLKATNGEIIATGEGYPTLQACRKGIASIQKNAASAITINLAANEDLIRSADKGDLQGIKRALQNGADVDFRDDEGETALIEATEAGNLAAVKHLVKAGAKLNLQDEEGETALHEAIEEDQIQIAKFLVKSGARANLKDKAGKTAKDLAKAKGLEKEIF